MILHAIKFYENGIGYYRGRWSVLSWSGPGEMCTTHCGSSLGSDMCERILTLRTERLGLTTIRTETFKKLKP